MPEKDPDAAEVIQSYRRRRERMVPLLLIGLAVVLVVVGIFLIVIFLTGDGNINLSFLTTETPTESPTETPKPPTATATITLTPTPSDTPTPEWPKTYVVELGDTLSSIADELGVSIELIIAYNDIITDPNNVPIGTQLTIPAPDSELPTATPLPDDLVTGDKIEYVVKLGDNLQTIAEKFNTTAEAIAEENEIEDQNSLWAGTVLIITIGPTPTPSPSPGPGTPSATPES